MDVVAGLLSWVFPCLERTFLLCPGLEQPASHSTDQNHAFQHTAHGGDPLTIACKLKP
jgi:hypothetical protein